MERLSTAEAIVSMLERNGIDRLFCLPGVQNDPLFDVLFDAAERIQVVASRHEEGAAYMALGAALATGRPSAYCVVPGPGFLNTTTALATAQSCGAQVLALIGQIPSAYIGRGLGLLHEIPDQSGMLRSLTKWSAGIKAPAEAPRLVDEAFRQLLNGRPQPVGLECPADVWAKRASVHPPEVAAERRALPIDDDSIEEAAELLGRARNPLIVVGGGAQEASAEITELAELLQAPVTAFRMGHGVVDSRNPLSVTVPIGHHLWTEADVVIGIGTRLQTQQLAWGVDDDLKIIRIDIDPAELNRLREPDVGLVGYADVLVRALTDRLPAHMEKRASRADEMRALKHAFAAKFEKLQPQLGYLDVIRDALRGGRHPGRRARPGRLCRALRLPGLQAPHLHLQRLSGHARLGCAHIDRRADGQAESTGYRARRRWRLHVQRAGAGGRRAARTAAGHDRLQRRRLRQCPAHPEGDVRQPPDRHRSGQSRLRETGGILRRAWPSGDVAGDLAHRPSRGFRSQGSEP